MKKSRKRELPNWLLEDGGASERVEITKSLSTEPEVQEKGDTVTPPAKEDQPPAEIPRESRLEKGASAPSQTEPTAVSPSGENKQALAGMASTLQEQIKDLHTQNRWLQQQMEQHLVNKVAAAELATHSANELAVDAMRNLIHNLQQQVQSLQSNNLWLQQQLDARNTSQGKTSLPAYEPTQLLIETLQDQVRDLQGTNQWLQQQLEDSEQGQSELRLLLARERNTLPRGDSEEQSTWFHRWWRRLRQE